MEVFEHDCNLIARKGLALNGQIVYVSELWGWVEQRTSSYRFTVGYLTGRTVWAGTRWNATSAAAFTEP